MTIPKWLKKPHQNVLIRFKQQGGHGNIADIRRYAQKKQGDPIAKALLKYGLMHGGKGSDSYSLTPEGREMARCLETNQAPDE